MAHCRCHRRGRVDLTLNAAGMAIASRSDMPKGVRGLAHCRCHRRGRVDLNLNAAGMAFASRSDMPTWGMG